jgi:GGDEF domain-containing protein
VISIRKTVDTLERLEELCSFTKSGYLMAIRSAADYAVELDQSQAEKFRANLHSLADLLDDAGEPDELDHVKVSFRGELREYRDKSVELLARMRSDLNAAASAMQSLSDTVASNGDDHQKQLKSDLRKLTATADMNDLGVLRPAIHEIASSISRSLDQMHQANQLALALLHDEIRALHREMDHERKLLQTDRASGAWNRDRIEKRLELLLEHDEPFSVIILRIANWKQLQKSCAQKTVESTLKAMIKRIFGILGTAVMVGRWSEAEFAVILESDSATAMAMAAEMSRQLSTRYSIQADDATQHVSLNVSSGIADQPPRGDAQKFRDRLEMLAAGLVHV